MNILYIAMGNGLNPNVGGSLIRSIETAKRLKEKSCNVTFFTTIGGFKACKSKNLDVNFIIVPCSIFRSQEKGILDRIFAYIISTLIFPFYLSKLKNTDIIYTDSDYFCDIIPAIVVKFYLHSKWVAMCHHIVSISNPGPLLYLISIFSSIFQKFSFFSFHLANSIFLYNSNMGKEIARQLVKYGINEDKIQYVANGIDVKSIESIKSEQTLFHACFIGGIRPNKGINAIVPVWKNVAERVPNAKLAIIGGGIDEYVTKLKKEIESENLNENILLLGALNHESTIKMLKSSKIFISLSYDEGWGIAICEAMACEKPVIAFDLNVFKHIFPESLIKVKVGDIDNFSEKILFCLNDRKKAREIAIENKNFIKKYDWDIIAKNELKQFKKV